MSSINPPIWDTLRKSATLLVAHGIDGDAQLLKLADRLESEALASGIRYELLHSRVVCDGDDS